MIDCEGNLAISKEKMHLIEPRYTYMSIDEIIDSNISSLLSLWIGNHGPCQHQLISLINESTYDSKFGMEIRATSIKC